MLMQTELDKYNHGRQINMLCQDKVVKSVKGIQNMSK